MEKYKDYIARTQTDRIALDTLYALEELVKLLTPNVVKQPEQIKTKRGDK